MYTTLCHYFYCVVQPLLTPGRLRDIFWFVFWQKLLYGVVFEHFRFLSSLISSSDLVFYLSSATHSHRHILRTLPSPSQALQPFNPLVNPQLHSLISGLHSHLCVTRWPILPSLLYLPYDAFLFHADPSYFILTHQCSCFFLAKNDE